MPYIRKTIHEIPGYERTVGYSDNALKFILIVNNHAIARKIRHSVFGDCIYYKGESYNID